MKGYFFQSVLEDCLARNHGRTSDKRIADVGVRSVASKLELPTRTEGFDELYFVRLRDEGGFEVSEYQE